VGLEAGGDHLGGQLVGGNAPDGEDGLKAGAGELLDAVGADVFEEEVTEGYAVQAFGAGAGESGGHSGFVVGVGAWEGKVDLPDGKARGGGLLIEEGFAVAVDGDAAKVLIDRGEEAYDHVLALLAEEVESPGAVFAAAPAEEDLGEGHWD
jgi:hypothetical protein